MGCLKFWYEILRHILNNYWEMSVIHEIPFILTFNSDNLVDSCSIFEIIETPSHVF